MENIGQLSTRYQSRVISTEHMQQLGTVILVGIRMALKYKQAEKERSSKLINQPVDRPDN